MFQHSEQSCCKEEQLSRSCHHIAKGDIRKAIRQMKTRTVISLQHPCGDLEVFG